MGLLDDAIREHLDLKRKRGADPGEIERLEREALGPVRREPLPRNGDAISQMDVHAEHGQADLHGQDEYHDPDFDSLPTQLGDGHVEQPRQEHKRGFLRRSRPAPIAESAPEGSAEHLGEDNEPSMHEQVGLPHDAEDPMTPAVAPAGATADTEPPHLVFDSPPPERPSFTTEPPGASEPADAPEQHDDTAAPPSDATVSATPPPRAPAAEDDPEVGATHEWDVEGAFAADDPDPPASHPTEPADEDVLEETPEFLQDTPDHDRMWFEQRPPRDFDFDG